MTLQDYIARFEAAAPSDRPGIVSEAAMDGDLSLSEFRELAAMLWDDSFDPIDNGGCI